MSAGLVYVNDIMMNFNVIDVLKGTASIYVENPWFPAPNGASPCDEKTFFKVKPVDPSKMKAIKGVYYTSPKIYIRKNLDVPFDARTKLITLPSKTTKEIDFKLRKPYEVKTTACNLKINVVMQDKTLVNKILLIDQRLNMLLDVMLTAKLLNISLAAFANIDNNNKFFTEFNKVIKTAVSKIVEEDEANSIKYTPEYIDSWNVLPIYYRFGDSYYCINHNTFNTKKEEIVNIKKGARSKKASIDDYTIHGVFSQLMDCTTMNGFTSENSQFRPSNHIKVYSKENDSNNLKSFDVMTLRFKVKQPNSRVPDGLITKRMVKRGGKLTQVILNSENVNDLWGGESSTAANYNGFLIISLQYDISLYKVASSLLHWDVDSYRGKIAAGTTSVVMEVDLPDISDDDEEGDTEVIVTSKKPVIKGTGGSIDLGNEDEDDDIST